MGFIAFAFIKGELKIPVINKYPDSRVGAGRREGDRRDSHKTPGEIKRSQKEIQGAQSCDCAPWGLNNRDRPCLKAGWYPGGLQ